MQPGVEPARAALRAIPPNLPLRKVEPNDGLSASADSERAPRSRRQKTWGRARWRSNENGPCTRHTGPFERHSTNYSHYAQARAACKVICPPAAVCAALACNTLGVVTPHTDGGTPACAP